MLSAWERARFGLALIGLPFGLQNSLIIVDRVLGRYSVSLVFLVNDLTNIMSKKD